MGSLRETQTILDLEDHSEALTKSDKLAAFIYRLIQNPGGT